MILVVSTFIVIGLTAHKMRRNFKNENERLSNNKTATSASHKESTTNEASSFEASTIKLKQEIRRYTAWLPLQKRFF